MTPAKPAPVPTTLTAPRKRWEPPCLLWEQQFIALAQVSQPPCIPGQDPRCTP